MLLSSATIPRPAAERDAGGSPLWRSDSRDDEKLGAYVCEHSLSRALGGEESDEEGEYYDGEMAPVQSAEL